MHKHLQFNAFLKKYFLSILSAFLLFLSFPKANIFFLSYFALVPLFFSIKDKNEKEAFFDGLVCGFIFNTLLLYWVILTIQQYGNKSFLFAFFVLSLLVFVLALFFASFTFLIKKFYPRPIIALFLFPSFWVCLEYIRHFLFTGLPWGLLGYSQANFTKLIQIADIFGVYGISFLIVLSNSFIFFLILFLKKKKWNSFQISSKEIFICFLFICFCFFLTFNYSFKKTKKINFLQNEALFKKISFVQGNIKQEEKWEKSLSYDILNKYFSLAEKCCKEGSNLIIFPETSIPYLFPKAIEMPFIFLPKVINLKTNLLFGAVTLENNKGFNSAYLFRASQKDFQRYDKVHLVPFGEYVPLRDLFSFLNLDFFLAQTGSFKAGESLKNLAVINENDFYKVGVQICFEIIFSNMSAELTRKGANLIVNITNDAWFGESAASYQHFDILIFRAIENRRSVVMSANTGISGFIDPTGNVLNKSTIFKDAVETKKMPLLNYFSFYTLHTDIFIKILFFVLFLLFFLNILTKYKKRGKNDF